MAMERLSFAPVGSSPSLDLKILESSILRPALRGSVTKRFACPLTPKSNTVSEERPLDREWAEDSPQLSRTYHERKFQPGSAARSIAAITQRWPTQSSAECTSPTYG
jgi:hypothetical protein